MNVMYGTMQDDTIIGTADDDFILDLAGRDIVHGGLGDDVFYNDRGNDRLFGEAGNDTFAFHPKTALTLDPGRRVRLDGGEGFDIVELSRSDESFVLREKGDNHVLTFRGDAMKLILRDVEQIVFTNETWDL